MKRILLAFVAIMVVAILVIAGCGEPAPTPTPTPTPAKTVTLKAAFYQPATHTAVLHFKEAFVDIEAATDGRVKFDVYDSQTLFKMPETLDALNRGIADLSAVPLPPFRTTIQWWGVELLPGLLKDRQGMHDAAVGGMTEMYQEAIRNDMGLNLTLAHMFCPGLSMVMTKDKRVAVPSDLKGLKVAVFDNPSANIMEVLGAVPVVMTQPEYYEALLRGMVDATLTNTSGNAQYKIQEPAEYLCTYSYGGPFVVVVLSQSALDQLSPADQAIVMSMSREYGMLEELAFGIGEQRMISDLIAPELKEVVYPTPEQLKLWDEAVAPVIDDFLANAGPDGQKAVDIIRQYN
jgi:C4-dicarboxylate-binding protein DctP